MHVHFACGVWRWLAPTFDDGTDWEAEAHFKMAALRLESARLEQFEVSERKRPPAPSPDSDMEPLGFGGGRRGE